MLREQFLCLDRKASEFGLSALKIEDGNIQAVRLESSLVPTIQKGSTLHLGGMSHLGEHTWFWD
jgi:hypothetical protein